MLSAIPRHRSIFSLISPRLISIVLLFSVISFSLTIVGCKKNSLRKDVWGTVTWKGQSIPNGFVNFVPDVSKGNDGPAGIAMIKDGKFDTRFENSRGCVAGSNIVVIHAYDGKGIQRMVPYGQPMFDGEVQLAKPLDVPQTGGEFNLVVPDNTKVTDKNKSLSIE